MADKLPSGKWRVRWMTNGRRCSKVFPNKVLADKFEAKIELEMVSELVGVDPSNHLAFAEFAEIWLRDYCKVEKAESQWAADASVIKHHLNPAFGHVRLIDLKKSDLAFLKARLVQTAKLKGKGKKYKPKSVNNILGTAKVMMATAVNWDFLIANPFSGVSPLKLGDQEFDFWKPEERDEFVERCNPIDKDFADAVLLACHTGMRKGELAGLRWDAVDFHRRKIRVHETYDPRLKKFIKRTKNMKFVDLPMNTLVLQTLSERKSRCEKDDSGNLVFPLGFLDWACHRLEKRCEWLNIRRIRFHDLRHTFASCLAMAGVDLMTIRELMRHQSYQMTLRYAHLHPDHLDGATDVLCAVSKTKDSQNLVMKNQKWSRNFCEKKSRWSQIGHEKKNGELVQLPVSR